MKKMFLLLMVVFTTSLFAAGSVKNYYNDLSKLNDNQMRVLVKAYEKGKPTKQEATLAAIAWNESSAGERLQNLSDGRYGSYGVYHGLLETVLERHGLKPTKANIALMAKKLKTDFDFASQEVIAELSYWKNIHSKKPNTYRAMLASYNTGNKGLNCGAGVKYSNDIALRVAAINKYVKDNPQRYANLSKDTGDKKLTQLAYKTFNMLSKKS
jgi:hypothetical protein